MGGLVNDDTIDTVVISDVIFKVKGPLEVKITGDVDPRPVNNPSLVVMAIVFYPSTKVSEVLS